MARERKKPNKGAQKTTVGAKIKGAILDLGVDLGLVKSPKSAVKEEQELVADIVAQGQKLKNRLQSITFRTQKIPEKQMAEEQKKIATLIVRLDDTMLSNAPDTRKIDQALFELCDHLQEAYRKGDPLTSHYIVEALTYGIVNGHKPLLEDERAREAEVMQKREKKLQIYLRLCQAAENIYQCGESIRLDTERLESDKKLLKEQIQEVKDFEKIDESHARAVEDIAKVGGNVKDLKGLMLEFATLRKSAVRTFKECELLKTSVALKKTTMNDYNAMISEMNISLNVPNEQAKEELINFVKELGKELMERVNQQVTDIIEMDATIDAYYEAMNSVFKQPRVENYILSAVEEFDNMMYEIQEEKDAFDRMKGRSALENELLEEELETEN